MSQSVFFRWNENMSVKSHEIDNQHMQLVNILNELYQAFMDKKHKEIMGVIIDKMLEYTRYHFDTEEKYFTRVDFYDKENHIKEHQDFKKKVNEFSQKYQINNGALTYDVINFLRHWLTNHIMETDKKYIECFMKNGI